MNAIVAFVLCRCPRCRVGKIFGPSFSTNPRCPSCGLGFDVERGYFSGAWAISFFLGFPVIFALTLVFAMYITPSWPLELAVLPAMLLFAIFVPVVWVYSRVLLIHLDSRWQPKKT